MKEIHTTKNNQVQQSKFQVIAEYDILHWYTRCWAYRHQEQLMWARYKGIPNVLTTNRKPYGNVKVDLGPKVKDKSDIVSLESPVTAK